ncbi:hypothetical protein PybrP1_001094 [[Pythium] brassicae (nom. inval.)]|nr:hypothetical protein PybrP1_001094 [[Pythium] brassicae (nom. inval.)]
MAREVKIVVKNVYAPAEQQQFIVEETALVRQLKLLVHAQFPGAPQPAHQKLIFGGKVCADSDALLTILSVNQMRSEEHAEDAAAVVFHLLVSGVPPRSRPSTPPASASAAPSEPPAAAVGSGAPETIDSPRPVAAAALPAAPTFSFEGSREATQQQLPPPAAAFALPHVASQPVPGVTASPQPDLMAQGLLMHQQAMILAQIQYLQYLKAHSEQHAQSQSQSQSHQAVAQQPVPHHPYAHFGYFGMGMPHPQMLNAMHGLQHPGGHLFAGPHAAAAVGAGIHPGHGAATPAAAPTEPAAPRQVPLVVQIAREILPLFDLRLAMKMAFMLFIIGQDTPNDRVLMLAFLSFVSYLHITGILAKVYEVYKRFYTPAVDANGAETPADGAAANALNHGANNGARGMAAGLARLDFARVLRISSDRGLVQDVKYFLVGFLLSLVPAWHPQPLHGTPAAPPVQDLPDVADMPVQGI